MDYKIQIFDVELLNNNWLILENIINNTYNNLSLEINSSLCISEDIIKKLIIKLNIIYNKEKAKNIILCTYVDGFGKQSEYGKLNFDFYKFWDTINYFLYLCPYINIKIISSYNIFSLPSYKTLIYEIYQLKREFSSLNRYLSTPVILNTSYLKYPTYKKISNNTLLDIQSHIYMMKSLQDIFFIGPLITDINNAFTESEINNFEKIYNLIENDNEIINRKNLISFIDEYDKIKGTNFLKIFPEYEDFYLKIKYNL